MPRTLQFSRSFWLTILALTFIVNVMAMRASLVHWNEVGVDLTRSVWGILMAAYLVIMAACVLLIAFLLRSSEVPFDISTRFQFLESDHALMRGLGWAIFLLVLILIPYVKFT
ncbi:MAG TPA: hypothetical protein VK897_25300, partial [Anaerolineales bacterium]|nr:hypothetical protein [Anaerolineales bacterium]